MNNENTVENENTVDSIISHLEKMIIKAMAELYSIDTKDFCCALSIDSIDIDIGNGDEFINGLNYEVISTDLETSFNMQVEIVGEDDKDILCDLVIYPEIDGESLGCLKMDMDVNRLPLQKAG